jgi:hypothetical protein
MAFLTQNKTKLWKILIITSVFEKNANFFAENCRKSQKIVIKTSTPAQFELRRILICSFDQLTSSFWLPLSGQICAVLSVQLFLCISIYAALSEQLRKLTISWRFKRLPNRPKKIWDRCYDFKKFSPKNLAKILAFFAQTTASFAKIWSKHWFLRKTPIFSPQIGTNRRKLWS